MGSGSDRDAVSPGAIVAVADATRKVAEVTDAGKLIDFKDKIIVSEALEFSETWRHVVECGLTVRCGGNPTVREGAALCTLAFCTPP